MTLILSGTNGLSDVTAGSYTCHQRHRHQHRHLLPAADTIAFAEGGAELRIALSGMWELVLRLVLGHHQKHCN
jgi:hypothetical protein